jgi:putative zinc finger/helix-turn-helix YgiT family protein
MKSPITGKEMQLHKEPRTFTFRKESFEIIYHSFLCTDTGEMFENEELSNLNLSQVQNKYREVHNLPFTNEIKEIRRRYGVSAIKMSEILGFGANTYRNYEEGEVPNDANGRLIQLASDPVEFRKLIKLSDLDKSDKERIIKKADVLHNTYIFNICNQSLGRLNDEKPGILNGYRRFDAEKSLALITWLSSAIKPWKTQLNKLLFYIDFTHFKHYGNSVTGMQYKAIPYGPVPDFYETIYELADDLGYIYKVYKDLDNGHEGEIFHAQKDWSTLSEIFASEEKETIERVLVDYGELSVNEIVSLSHKEPAWNENVSNNSKISYHYSFFLAEL